MLFYLQRQDRCFDFEIMEIWLNLPFSLGIFLCLFNKLSSLIFLFISSCLKIKMPRDAADNPLYDRAITAAMTCLFTATIKLSAMFAFIWLWLLKEYYEIVDEARPQSGFFSHTFWFFLRKFISNHETKQSSKFLSDPSPNCFTIDVWNINCWRQQFISYLSYFIFCIACYGILHEFCSVLRCDILGIGLF